MGREVYAGDSARIRATFVFDALAPEDTVFDFRDGDDGWNVMGVNLHYRPCGMRTHISGVLHGQPSHSWALLVPRNSDFRVNKSVIVPIENGRFEYDLFTTDTLAYDMIVGMQLLEGSWDMHPFFAEGVPVRINLNVDDGKFWSRIQGGPLTERMKAPYMVKNEIMENSGLNEEIERLDSLRLFYTPEVYDLHDRISREDRGSALSDSLVGRLIELERAGKQLSPLGKAVRAKGDSVRAVLEQASIDFIETDSTLAGLEAIVGMAHFHDDELDRALDIFSRVYASRYPGHPYTSYLNNLLANGKMAKGGHYPDFSAPDLEGDVHRLSDLIAGKYAVINLWASWCGPCRRHSKELIHVYEKWKDRGFTVVGVARESGSTGAMERSIERDGYPWLNLAEINDANGIWVMYRAANAGGRMVLVDPDGIIIAIDPTAAEVEDVLQKMLGS